MKVFFFTIYGHCGHLGHVIYASSVKMASMNEEIITENKVLKTKRARSKNFDYTENDRLIEYASKHRTVIKSKLTNSVTVQKKRRNVGVRSKKKLIPLVMPKDLSLT